MTSKDGQILLNIDADISKFETKLESLEKKKIKDIKLNVDDSSIEKTQRQIDLLVSKIERLYETREKLSTSFLSSEKQREALRLKNKEQAIRLEIEKEKQKFKAIELEHQKWEAKYSARTQRSILNIKNAHTLELREHSKMLAAKTNADKEYEKTFFGAITGGTSFGHKLATTAQYALAGSALYGVANAARQATAAIIETDKYFNMFRGVLEQTDEQAKKLQQSIFNVGKEFGGTNQQLSEAALQLGRAGLKGEALASGLKVASQMALVAGDGLENITEMLTAWSIVYPEKKMEDLGDMMVAVSNASLLSIDGLKTATSYILATGQSAGMTADSLIQLAGAWKQTGKADSIVGTEIRRLFEQIENASEDVRKAYWEMGIDLNKVNEGLKSESAEVKEATFRSFMGMIANVENLAPAQKKAVDEAIAQLQVLDKQTVNSSKVASKSYAGMEKAGDKAAGSLNESSKKIAVSYEKMIERLIIAGKESSVVFEETFSKALFGGEGGTEKFNKEFDKLSKKLNAFAETTGEAAAVIVEHFDKIALAATLYKVSGWLDKGFAAHGIALAAQAVAVGKLSTAWKAFNLVLAKNPLIFAAMAGITIYGLLADDIYDATAAVEEFNKANRKTFDDNSTVEVIEAQIDAYSKEVEAREKVLKGLEPDTAAYDTQIAHIKNLTSELNKLYAIIDKRDEAVFTAIDAEFAKLETGVDISAKGDLKTADKRGGESSKDKALKEQFKEYVKLIKLDEERWLTQNATATEIEKQAHHTNTTLQYTVLLAKAYQGVKGLSDDIVQTQIDLEEGQRKLNDLVIQNKEAAQDKIAQNNYELSIMRDITEEALIRNEATKSYQSVADAYLASQKTIYDEQVAQSGVLKVQAETEYKLEELARKRAEANTLVSLELQEQRNAQTAMLNNEIGLSPAQNEFDAVAMQYQIDQRRLELQLVEDIRNTEDPAQIQAINDAYLARTSLLKDNLDILEQMTEFKIKIEGIDKLEKVVDNFSNLSAGSENLEKTQKGLLSFSTKMLGLSKNQVVYEKKFLALNELKSKGTISEVDYNKQLLKLDEEQFETQMQGYSAVATAMSSMFEEGSKEAAAFQAIEAGLAIVAGVQAILTQGKGDPYSAFARMAAMTAAVVSLLGSAGIAFGANKITSSTDAFSAMAANEGTGSVLGDTIAQSESIKNSLDTLSDYARPEFSLLSEMNKSLLSIDQKISGFASLLIREGGFAFGEGYEGFDTGAALTGVLGDVSKINDMIFDNLFLGFDKKLLGISIGGMFGGITNSVLGGLFGKTSVSQKMTDSGIYFANTLLTTAMDDFNGAAYQTIQTTTKKKSWFSSKTSVSTKTYFAGLDDELEHQFELVLSGLYDTTLLAGEALDVSALDVEKSLENFVVAIGKISLKDKTGDQIQETLEAVFGEIGDNIASTAFPLLADFQKVGEGMFDVMTRVATGMEEAEYYINRLGKGFEDIKYTDIENKQGDVGFEALSQSIIKADEAMYGFNNGVVLMIENMSGTADELYNAYKMFEDIRGMIELTGQDSKYLTASMIMGAGSTDELIAGMEEYFDNFLTEEEQLAYKTEYMRKEFEKLDLSLPTSASAFKDLIAGIDLSTEAGQELYGRAIMLSEGFYEVIEASEDLATELAESFRQISESIQETIDQLLGNLNSNDQEASIEKYWAKRAELDVQFANNGSVEEIERLVSEVNALSLSIQNIEEFNKEPITASLVSELTNIKTMVDFENEILRVSIVSSEIPLAPTSTYTVPTNVTSNTSSITTSGDALLTEVIEMKSYIKKLEQNFDTIMQSNYIRVKAVV